MQMIRTVQAVETNETVSEKTTVDTGDAEITKNKDTEIEGSETEEAELGEIVAEDEETQNNQSEETESSEIESTGIPNGEIKDESGELSSNVHATAAAMSTFAALQSAVNNAADGVETVLEISNDLTFLAPITIPETKKITIQSVSGEKYILTCAAGRHFNIEGSLTLNSITLNGSDTGGGVFVSGKFIMNDNAIIEDSVASNGGGVYVHNSGNFIMNGGDIYGNRVSGQGAGAGVYVNGAFTMSGGEIQFNEVYLTGSFGGGVHISTEGSFIMSGGEIHENHASYGGGVDVDGKFTMLGGVIWGNTVSYQGGGVGVYYGTFTMKDGTIRNNEAKYGGGVHVANLFEMNGGSIYGNTAPQGGGVCIRGEILEQGIFNMNGGTISSNYASEGGGVCSVTGIIRMSGGIINNNTADSSSGGMYIGYLYKITGGNITGNSVDNIMYGTDSLEDSDIPKPTNITVNAASTSALKISWTKGADVTGYEVWYATSLNSTYQKVKDTTGTSYTHSGLIAGNTYYYKIRSYITISATKIYGSYTTVKSKVMLQTPMNVKLTNSSANSLKISWKKVSEASGYEIYYAPSKSQTYKKIKTITSGTTVSYTNKNLANGKTYYYKIRAYKTVNGNKKYSSYCSIISKKVLLAKTTLTATTKNKSSIKLSWIKVAGAKNYEIYQATSKKGSYKKIKTTTSLTYTDTKLESNKTYYYKVKAVQVISKKTYKSAYSEVQSAKTKK